MWAIWILAGMVAVSGYMMTSQEVRSPQINTLRSVDLAENMGIYRAAVLQYAKNNPTFIGTVPDASLTFPAYGYVKNPLWTNNVSGGTVVVYATAFPPVSITAEIVALSKNSIFAGEANNNKLFFSDVRYY